MGDPLGFLVSALFLIPGVAIAVPLHEIGHGLAAHWQGDRTVRHRGLFDLDLKQYFEPYGLAAAFLAKVAWGRPLAINESRLDTFGRRLGYALGGPAASLLGAIVFGLILRWMLALGITASPVSLLQAPQSYLATIVFAIYFMNLSMFAFNLLPIPGLDGWRVIEAIFRRRYPRLFFDAWMRRREVWAITALIVVVASFLSGGATNLLAVVMLPLYAPTSHLILGGCVGYYGLSPCPASGFP